MKINKNTLTADFFFNILEIFGVEDVCISPGSRNTPLIFALHKSKLNKHIILDERSSAFFALGLAKYRQKAVAVITTSGTAAAELYPAIVEARMSRTPLIICTADRPAELLNSGANQTIFQKGMYAGHVVADLNVEWNEKSADSHLKLLQELTEVLQHSEKGPVHLNFPFSKPLEPDKIIHDVPEELFNFMSYPPYKGHTLNNISEPCMPGGLTKRPALYFTGWPQPAGDTATDLLEKTRQSSTPVIADIASGLRSSSDSHIIRNGAVILSSSAAANIRDFFGTLIQFGAIPTSNEVNSYWKKSPAEKYCVHPYDHHDASRSSQWIRCRTEEFIRDIPPGKKDSAAFQHLIDLDQKAEKLKTAFLNSCEWNFEGRIQHLIHGLFPEGSLVLYGNSTAIRDADLFAGQQPKNSRFIVNRGASGIDGLLSTALGAAIAHGGPAFYISGDLSLIYDISALKTALEMNIPLCIILLDNGGGGIFHRLPVSEFPEHFDKYFFSPHSLDLKAIAESFQIQHQHITSLHDLRTSVSNYIASPSPSLIHISTDAAGSQERRREYFKFIHNKLLNRLE